MTLICNYIIIVTKYIALVRLINIIYFIASFFNVKQTFSAYLHILAIRCNVSIKIMRILFIIIIVVIIIVVVNFVFICKYFVLINKWEKPRYGAECALYQFLLTDWHSRTLHQTRGRVTCNLRNRHTLYFPLATANGRVVQTSFHHRSGSLVRHGATQNCRRSLRDECHVRNLLLRYWWGVEQSFDEGWVDWLDVSG